PGLEAVGVGDVVGQAVGGDDLPDSFLEDKASFPRCVETAGGCGGEEGPGADLGEIAGASESAGGGVVAAGIAETLRVDGSAAGAQGDAAIVGDVEAGAELEGAAVEGDVSRGEGGGDDAQTRIGADAQDAADDGGAVGGGVGAVEDERSGARLGKRAGGRDQRVDGRGNARIDGDEPARQRQRCGA